MKRAIGILMDRERIEPATIIELPGSLAADAQAYWSSSSTETHHRDMSHWRGSGRWADEQEWRQIGDQHFTLYQTLLQLSGRREAVQSMVEWGPGGGANVVRFGMTIPRLYGVDISKPNLVQCRREAESSGYRGFVPVEIDATEPTSAIARIGEKVDLFLSTAVYQHFPSKAYGVRVNQVAYQLLADCGIALIQIRYDDGSVFFAPKSSNYHDNAIVFTSYRVDEFWRLASDVGFRPLAVVLRPQTNYAYYLLTKD